MNLLAYLHSLGAKFFHHSQVADEMEEELRSHVQHRADDLERSGLDRAQAERRARIEFGARERFKEECQPGQPVCSSRCGPFSRSCSAARSRFEPATHPGSCAVPDCGTIAHLNLGSACR